MDGGGGEPTRDDERSRIIDVRLDEASIRRHPDVQHELDVALYDLKEQSEFQPLDLDGSAGPFVLHLSLRDNTLVIGIHDDRDDTLTEITVPMSGFKRVIRDYFTICESYFQAIRSASPSQIEAIDMGRRGLHNEGSELLRERLKDKVAMDFDTARRLFTVICVLHIKGAVKA